MEASVVLSIVVLLTAASSRVECEIVVDESETSLADTVRTLRGQVNALLERRQEDYRLLEDSLKRSLEKNSELSSLRTQVANLRHELDALRGTSAGNQQRNDHLTVQWLAGSVTELRAELAEVSAAHNASVELQQHQALVSELALVRGDAASLRHEVEGLRAQQTRALARLAQLAQDNAASRAQSQAVAAVCADAKEQLESSRTEWMTAIKAVKKSPISGKWSKALETASEENNAVHAATDDRRFRHHRALRKQIEDLERVARKSGESQARLEHDVRRLQKQVKTSLGRHGGAGPGNNMGDGAMTALQERVANLESSSRMAARSMFNMSRQVVQMDKLHLSMLQLLESVETLENKVDHSVPDLQREISKMEFHMAQMSSSVALIKEDHENQRASLKAMSSAMTAVQEKLDTERGRITVLQTQLVNRTAGTADGGVQRRVDTLEAKLQHLSTQKETSFSDAPSNGSAWEVVDKLTHVQEEYRHIVEGMPRDCGGVTEPSGLYLISPDGGKPLLTSCNAGGWTIIQRRVDGSQEFNRKWTEYEAGFGSPSGEFWLGNAALHALTRGNCSTLRVELEDIYGRPWAADYSEFSVGPASDGYRLHVGGYSGNASDALAYQEAMQFSAVDRDRDASSTHCAANYEGGWWFSHCQHANLNGRYTLGLTWFDGSRNEWIAVARSEMKVRRRESCGGA